MPQTTNCMYCANELLLEHLLDLLPENLPLYKDSGLWQLRTDDMEDVICSQGANEAFRPFIERCLAQFVKDEEGDLVLNEKGYPL